MQRSASLFVLAVAAAPSLALASTTTDVVSEIAGLFYIIVGLAVVAAFLMMGAGTIMWIVRLGTDNTYRNDAIHIMEWSVATLFTLILVLGVVEFIQSHTSTTLYILSIAIVLFLVWVIMTSGILTGGGGEEEHE